MNGWHLVTVKVGVEGFAVGVVEAQRLLAGQDADFVGHDGRLVQRRLPVEQHDVAVPQVPVDHFGFEEAVARAVRQPAAGALADFDGRLRRRQQRLGGRVSLARVRRRQADQPSVLLFDEHGARMDVGPVAHQFAQLLPTHPEKVCQTSEDSK